MNSKIREEKVWIVEDALNVQFVKLKKLFFTFINSWSKLTELEILTIYNIRVFPFDYLNRI